MSVEKRPSLLGRNLSCLAHFYPAEARRVRRVLADLRHGRRPPRFRLIPAPLHLPPGRESVASSQYLCRQLGSPSPVWVHGPDPPTQTASRTLRNLSLRHLDHLVIWRSGLGYLPAFAFQKTDKRLSILEPDEELFTLSLEAVDWVDILASPRCLLSVGLGAKHWFRSLIRSCPEVIGSCWKVVTGIEPTDTVSTELNELTDAVRKCQELGTNLSEEPGLSVDLFIHGPPTIRIFLPAFLEAAARMDYRAVCRSSGDARFRFLCFPPFWGSFLEGGKPSLMLGINRGALPPPAEKALAERHIPQVLYFLEDADWYDFSMKEWDVFDRVYVFDPTHGRRLESLGFKGRRVLPSAASLYPVTQFPSWMGAQPYPVTFVGSSGLNRQSGRYFDQMERVRPGVRSDFERLIDGCLRFGASWVRERLPKEERLVGLGSQGLQLKMIEEAATTRRRISFLSSLCDQPLTLFGDRGWADTKQTGRLSDHYAGRHTAYPMETAAVYCHSEININLLHRQCEYSINHRVYDVMACGGFLLSEHSPALEETFKIGEELDTFRSPEELREKVIYYQERPEERKEIARSGRTTVIHHHTYTHRLQIIRNDLGLGDL